MLVAGRDIDWRGAKLTKYVITILVTACLAACADGGLTPGEGYIDVEGGRVWYQVVGSGNETPLLLLHGGPGAPSHYLKPLEQIADDRPVVFYDQLGAGRSPAPNDPALWTVERFVQELDDVRSALGLDDVHILGHSWGSMLAMDYLLTEPEGVHSVIFASPALNVGRWTEDARNLLKALPADTQAIIEQHELDGTTDSPEYQEAVMAYYEMYLSRSEPWSSHLMDAFEGFNTDLYGYMWGPSEFTATGTLQNYNRESDLRDLTLPVLFTTGRYDEAIPETVEHFQSLVPGAKLLIFENSAHMTMLDEPEAYTEAVQNFLRSVDSSR